jgi:DNA-binding XRE family transcriptional regulator
MSRRRWIDPQDFADLRKQAGLTRKEAAQELDVTPRTIQNWETGGARIPWMAYRMLRILPGYALPGEFWEGWTVRGRDLINPAGRTFDANWLEHVELIYSQARLWRQMYSNSGRVKTASTVVPFPDRMRKEVVTCHRNPETDSYPSPEFKKGGTR